MQSYSIVDNDVSDTHVENLMESGHSPQVSHNRLDKSDDLPTETWITTKMHIHSMQLSTLSTI